MMEAIRPVFNALGTVEKTAFLGVRVKNNLLYSSYLCGKRKGKKIYCAGNGEGMRKDRTLESVAADIIPRAAISGITKSDDFYATWEQQIHQHVRKTFPHTRRKGRPLLEGDGHTWDYLSPTGKLRFSYEDMGPVAPRSAYRLTSAHLEIAQASKKNVQDLLNTLLEEWLIIQAERRPVIAMRNANKIIEGIDVIQTLKLKVRETAALSEVADSYVWNYVNHYLPPDTIIMPLREC
jgi:hypothetical protein